MLVAFAVGLLIFPIPAVLLDALLAAQLGASVVVLLAAVFARSPLALSQLPTVLLLTTLIRLALNVSTTRLILGDGEAGQVVAAFGDAVVRGNLVVGAVVFLVLTVVQYLVIARGAERVAQVSARFALDGLPGRQLAIDADVRSGLLDPESARSQRVALARESNLFGALDGAMKFVRGDAIAGLCIVGVNLVGGLVVGMAQQGLSPMQAIEIYTKLTVGDGLVTQLPAMLTATAAALVVTRVATSAGESAPGAALLRELVGDGRAPALAAGLLGVLAILPGLPFVPLVLVGLALGATALVARRRPPEAAARSAAEPVVPVVPLGLHLHPEAARQVEGAPAVLAAIRRTLRDTHGVSPSGAVVALDARLPAQGFRIEVGEATVAQGTLPESDPQAYLVRTTAAAWRRAGVHLLSMQQVADALAALEQREPALVRAAVPRAVPLPRLTALLRRLLAEDLPVRDLTTVLEALAHRGDSTTEDEQLRLVRRAFAPQISQRFAPEGRLDILLPDEILEAALRGALGVGPDLAAAVFDTLEAALATSPQVVVLAPPDLRSAVQALVSPRFSSLPVLSAEELMPGVKTRIVGLLPE